MKFHARTAANFKRLATAHKLKRTPGHPKELEALTELEVLLRDGEN